MMMGNRGVSLSTSVRERVLKVLLDFPETRDNDKLLTIHIWSEESSLSRTDLLGKFIDKFIAGELTNTESIRRVRQKLQEEHEMLRGKMYGKRRDKQKEIVNELRHGFKRDTQTIRDSSRNRN
jgi:hypothetical protein